MSPKITLHLAAALYCAGLVSQNWFRLTTHSGPTGFSREEILPVEMAAGVSGAIAILLALICLWKARSRLERGIKVRTGKWIRSYFVFLYALPLLWGNHSSATSVAPDGSTTVVSHGYGHALSPWLFGFAVLGLLLLQIALRLREEKNDPRQVSRPMSELRTATAQP